MIPTIQNRIDLTNDDGDSIAHRATIPDEEIAELSELRKRDHILRAREKHESELLKMVEAAETRAYFEGTTGQESDPERLYGLPEGEAYYDIWEQILRHVMDLHDIKNVRDSCVLFGRLMEDTYMVLFLDKLTNAPSKILHRLFNLNVNTLLSLRGVCKTSKRVIDHLFQREWFPRSLNSPMNSSLIGDLKLKSDIDILLLLNIFGISNLLKMHS